jgi:hypothetical protein
MRRIRIFLLASNRVRRLFSVGSEMKRKKSCFASKRTSEGESPLAMFISMKKKPEVDIKAHVVSSI